MIVTHPYGNREQNPLDADHKADFHNNPNGLETVDWTDPRLGKIVRLRLLTDSGFPAYDVSYCHGRLKDGTPVEVSLPFDQLPKGKGRLFGAILAHAKRDKVYAKGLGLLDRENISIAF